MSTPNAKRPGNTYLPEDIILDILLRLPVIALLRFKCVCKKWYNIISSQSFVKEHYSHTSNTERLLIGRFRHNSYDTTYTLVVDDTLSAFEEPAHLQMPDKVRILMGPVNGIFCLVGNWGELALLNPATRQLRPLPKQPEIVLEQHLRFHEHVLGFGLDPLSGHYKVVSIWYLWDETANALDRPPLVFVYNSGTDSWRYALPNQSSYIARHANCNLYLNGVYYWIIRHTYIVGILAFDMITETFEDIEVPDCVKSKWGYLTVLNDSIALLTWDLQKVGAIEVWVREKEERWKRVAVVDPFDDIICPVSLWKNNEIMFLCVNSAFTLYNMRTKNIRLPAPRLGQDTYFINYVYSYKESLVSIKGGRDNCMFWDASDDTLSIGWA